MTDTRSEVPQFVAPEPINGERIEGWHRRVIDEFQRFVNEELVPSIAERSSHA